MEVLKAPHVQITEPEVFILESLEKEDELAGRCEGRILADILQLCGKKPQYKYFRTEKELVDLSDVFRASGYRYLHLSCHGDEHHLYSTSNAFPFHRFAEIFSGKLQNRRLFLSACQAGNEKLVREVSQQNRGMYSILAPRDKIAFSHAMAIWAAFYVKLFDIEPEGPKNRTIVEALEMLCPVFGTTFWWSYHETAVQDKWLSQLVGQP